MILSYIDKSPWLFFYRNIWLIPYPMVRWLYPLGIAGIWIKWWWWWWWWWWWRTLPLSFKNHSHVRKKYHLIQTQRKLSQKVIQWILLLTPLGIVLSMSHEDQYEHAPLASHCFLAVVSVLSQFQEDATHPVNLVSEHLVVHEWR